MAMMLGSVSSETESIGQRLRRLRTERGLSQRELAEPGVSYAYISRIEAGTRQPSVKALRKLARKLGVSAEYLETGSEISADEQREMRLTDAELELRLEHDPEGSLQKLRGILDEAVEVGDTVASTRARLVLGGAALDQGRPSEAVTLLEEAVAQTDVLPSARPDVYSQIGRAYAMLGQVDRAIEVFEGCLAEVEANEPENVAARVRYATYLSHALGDAGELERAQSVLTDVLAESNELADIDMQIRLYWSLARVAFMRGQHSLSLDYARRALALVAATEDTVQLGRAYLMCGAILIRQGKAEEAMPQLTRAERLLGARPNPPDLAYLRTEQAKAGVLLGNGKEAARRAREALDVLGDTDPAERGAAWLALAQGLSLEGEVPAAMESFRRATEALEEAGKLPEAAEAHRAWSRALRAAGRESEALDVLERAADLAAQAGHTEIRATR
jgi:transcriptional regulator with XRE-family HTH domain